MPVAVTGSIATDHLMTFPGKFVEQFVEGQMENVSLSFLVDDLVQHRGGAGANMAYGLGLLGLQPVLVGAVGNDFAEYEAWLKPARRGHRRACTGRSSSTPPASSARPTRPTTRSRPSTRAPCRRPATSSSARWPRGWAVSTSWSSARTTRRRWCGTPRSAAQAGYAFAADPSQQLAWADGEMIRDLVDGADLLFTNEYESHLLQQKTGWDVDEVLSRVGTWITTRAAEGILVRQAGAEPISVIAVPETKPVEPTGGGDALRAGFIAGRMWGLSLERATQLGSAVATAAVEVIGTQEYDLPKPSFLARFADAFGDDAADEVAPHLPG